MRNDARRIECARGHVVVVLKTEPETADKFANDFMASRDGTCVFCGSALTSVHSDIHDFERWSSREDRCMGSNA